jgi:hypothetical protein
MFSSPGTIARFNEFNNLCSFRHRFGRIGLHLRHIIPALKPKYHRLAGRLYMPESLREPELISVPAQSINLSGNFIPKLFYRVCSFPMIARTAGRIEIVYMVEPINLFR